MGDTKRFYVFILYNRQRLKTRELIQYITIVVIITIKQIKQDNKEGDLVNDSSEKVEGCGLYLQELRRYIRKFNKSDEEEKGIEKAGLILICRVGSLKFIYERSIGQSFEFDNNLERS